jgi:FixJ family two-component response regulator
MRSVGYIARTFASAEEFLQSPHISDTSCLISDVQMPNMSGIELQSHLAAQSHRTPIIFITAFPDENVRAQALKAGVICFLLKPFDGDSLLRHVDEALGRSNGESVDD